MAMCANPRCDIELGLLHGKRTCSGCGQLFCNDHVCDSKFWKHLRGEGLVRVDKAYNDRGDLCLACIGQEYQQVGIPAWEFLDMKTCSASECDKDLTGVFESVKPCSVCGRNFCSDHVIERKDVNNKWIVENARFVKADWVCKECYEKDGPDLYTNVEVYHEKALNLKLVAGNRKGKRKAILVHGILSGHEKFDEIGTELVRTRAFDVVWAFDDLLYRGRVNDVVFNPTSIAQFLRSLSMYTIHGTAKNLATTINLLDWKNLTLIGHSLGGIVSRCAAECYISGSRIGNVITLASPFRHQLFNISSKNHQWKTDVLNGDIKYLSLIGKKDYVVTNRSYCNLTSDDSQWSNLLKIMIDDADHSSIHANIRYNKVGSIIKAFVVSGDFDCFKYHKCGEDYYISDKASILGMTPVDKSEGDWYEVKFSEGYDTAMRGAKVGLDFATADTSA